MFGLIASEKCMFLKIPKKMKRIIFDCYFPIVSRKCEDEEQFHHGGCVEVPPSVCQGLVGPVIGFSCFVGDFLFKNLKSQPLSANAVVSKSCPRLLN